MAKRLGKSEIKRIVLTKEKIEAFGKFLEKQKLAESNSILAEDSTFDNYPIKRLVKATKFKGSLIEYLIRNIFTTPIAEIQRLQSDAETPYVVHVLIQLIQSAARGNKDSREWIFWKAFGEKPLDKQFDDVIDLRQEKYVVHIQEPNKETNERILREQANIRKTAVTNIKKLYNENNIKLPALMDDLS